jgi:hypothetical protein
MRRVVGHRRREVMHDRAFADRVRARGYQVAYVNTIAPKREIVALTRTRIPLICHVHELDFSMRYWLGKDGLAPVVPGIAPAQTEGKLGFAQTQDFVEGSVQQSFAIEPIVVVAKPRDAVLLRQRRLGFTHFGYPQIAEP